MVVTYPLNDADFGAADAELFHCTRTSGVFDGGDFECSVTGADNNVTVGEGIGWIRNAKFTGKVVALKEPIVLNLGVADATYPRIDAVALQFDANANKTEVVVIPGTPAANPEPPEPIRAAGIYELHLYHVRREVGAAAIPVSALADVRMNSKYCGLMQDDVTPKTEDGPKSVDGIDMNTVKVPGKYYGSTMLNAGEAGISVFDVEAYSPEWLVQTQKRIAGNGIVRLYIRSFYNGTSWGPWRPILTNILPESMVSAEAPASGVKNQLHFVEV